MTLCGVTAAFDGYSNEEGEPFGLSTSAVDAELGKPMEDRRMKLASLRPEGESGLYTFWKSRQR